MIKIKIDREQFLDKLKKAYRFVGDKAVIPAFNNFKITVCDGIMEIIGGDPQSQIKIFCPAKSSEAISICLPAELLLKTINLFRENEVVINVKSETKVELKNGKAKYNLTMDTRAEDFPMMRAGASGGEVCLHQFYLKASLRFTERFISDESSKVGATGINIDEIDNRIIFTGVDSFTMCRANIKPISIGEWSKNIVLPVDTAIKLMSILDEKGEIFLVHCDDKMIFFTDGQSSEKFEVTTVAMNSKFPGSEKIFNKRGSNFLTLNTLEFKDAIDRLSLYASKLNTVKKITVKTNPENLHELILTAVDNDYGKDGEEIITINNNANRAMKKTFNSAFILNILKCIEEIETKIYFEDDDKIVCFVIPKADESKENNLAFLIGTTSE